MFATSGSTSVSDEGDSDSSASHAIASVPAAVMSLFVIVVHFALIYAFKKRFVANFAKCDDVVEKGRHSLVKSCTVDIEMYLLICKILKMKHSKLVT